MHGRVPGLEELKDFLKIQCGRCRSCLFNNYGPRRREFGGSCGLNFIFRTIEAVAANHSHPGRHLSMLKPLEISITKAIQKRFSPKKKKLSEDDFV